MNAKSLTYVGIGIVIMLLAAGCMGMPPTADTAETNTLTQAEQSAVDYQQAYINANSDEQEQHLTEDAFVHTIERDALPEEIDSVSQINGDTYRNETNVSLSDEWLNRPDTALVKVNITNYGMGEDNSKYHKMKLVDGNWKVSTFIVR